MDRLIRTHGKEHMMTHLNAIAADLGGPLAREEDMRLRLRKVVRLYNELGFEARLERKNDRLLLVQRNCPFLKIARDDPEALCACLDEGILRAALPGSQVSLEKSLAMGDARCVHEIRLPRARSASRVSR
jgi:predicted ArsR family transcriptional regulator